MSLQVITGDALESLKGLESESVHCVVTSPPYFGLTAYGTPAQVWGGDPACAHSFIEREHRDTRGQEGSTLQGRNQSISRVNYTEGFCACGAWRGELGQEPTPELYVAHVVEIFREVRRVLRKDGTCWVNFGDSYNGGGGYSPDAPSNVARGDKFNAHAKTFESRKRKGYGGLKPKDLIGIPWRVAFALQADGWHLRNDLPWVKGNGMPESMRDRYTRSHEYFFLLTKSDRYFFDVEAVKRPVASVSVARAKRAVSNNHKNLNGAPGQPPHTFNQPRPRDASRPVEELRHPRTSDPFWDSLDEYIDHLLAVRESGGMLLGTDGEPVALVNNTKGYADAHFATFPPELIKPCILAGCPSAGKRCDCDEVIATPTGTGEIDDPSIVTGRAGFNRPRRQDEGTRPITRREQREYARQIKESPHRAEMATEAGEALAHYVRTDRSGARPLPPALLDEWLSRGWLTQPSPCDCPVEPAGIVLDPFGGSGTTGKVAIELGRRAILIELNPEYVPLIERRCTTTMGLRFDEAVA